MAIENFFLRFPFCLRRGYDSEVDCFCITPFLLKSFEGKPRIVVLTIQGKPESMRQFFVRFCASLCSWHAVEAPAWRAWRLVLRTSAAGSV